MRVPILALLLLVSLKATLTWSSSAVGKAAEKRPSKTNVLTSGQNRLMAGVAHRPVKAPDLRKVAVRRNPLRSAAHPRPPGRVARIVKPGAPGDGTTHVVIPIPTVRGGPPLFTPATTSTSTSTTTATTTKAAPTCTSSCTLGYYTVCLASQICSGPCCAPGMVCSYSIEGNGNCFPPLG